MLRVDYHGIGDSAGNIEQVDSLNIWTTNIEQAIDHLKEETSASSVMLIGQRLGGLLAGLTATRRPDVNSLVLWESVVDGKTYLDSLRKMHAEMLDLWVCKMKTTNDSQHEEILGSLFSRRLIDELESTMLDVSDIPQPHLIVESPKTNRKFTHSEPSIQRVIEADRDGAWNDLRELESAFLRPVTTSTIVKTVNNMFDRLDGYGVLNSNSLAGVN